MESNGTRKRNNLPAKILESPVDDGDGDEEDDDDDDEDSDDVLSSMETVVTMKREEKIK